MALEGHQSDITRIRKHLRGPQGVDWLDCGLREVGRHGLKGFLAHLKTERTARDGTTGLKPNTRNTYFSAINSFSKYLEWVGYIEGNPVPAFRERYLENSRSSSSSKRQLISIEEMSSLVHSILDVRDRALVLTLAKTGIRRGGNGDDRRRRCRLG